MHFPWARGTGQHRSPLPLWLFPSVSCPSLGHPITCPLLHLALKSCHAGLPRDCDQSLRGVSGDPAGHLGWPLCIAPSRSWCASRAIFRKHDGRGGVRSDGCCCCSQSVSGLSCHLLNGWALSHSTKVRLSLWIPGHRLSRG